MTFPNPAHLTTLTFDCYGTLIDWETGAIAVLRPLLLRHGIALSDDEIVTTFQDIEGALCEPPYKPYRAVLAGVVEGFGRRFGFPVEAADREALVSSVASWRPFPDTARYKLWGVDTGLQSFRTSTTTCSLQQASSSGWSSTWLSRRNRPDVTNRTRPSSRKRFAVSLSNRATSRMSPRA